LGRPRQAVRRLTESASRAARPAANALSDQADEDDEIALAGPGAELNITRPAQVIDPESGAPVDAPDSLLEWFTGHPKPDASEPVEVQLDCVDSHYIDLAGSSSTTDVRLPHRTLPTVAEDGATDVSRLMTMAWTFHRWCSAS
jgi:hypothetical protein